MAPGGFADKFGQQIVAAELTRGFTVIRRADGTVDFGLGIVEKGKEPFHPYQIKGQAKVVLANERIEVHSGPARVSRAPSKWIRKGERSFSPLGSTAPKRSTSWSSPRTPAISGCRSTSTSRGTTPPNYPPLMSDVAPR